MLKAYINISHKDSYFEVVTMYLNHRNLLEIMLNKISDTFSIIVLQSNSWSKIEVN